MGPNRGSSPAKRRPTHSTRGTQGCGRATYGVEWRWMRRGAACRWRAGAAGWMMAGHRSSAWRPLRGGGRTHTHCACACVRKQKVKQPRGGEGIPGLRSDMRGRLHRGKKALRKRLLLSVVSVCEALRSASALSLHRTHTHMAAPAPPAPPTGPKASQRGSSCVSVAVRIRPSDRFDADMFSIDDEAKVRAVCNGARRLQGRGGEGLHRWPFGSAA